MKRFSLKQTSEQDFLCHTETTVPSQEAELRPPGGTWASLTPVPRLPARASAAATPAHGAGEEPASWEVTHGAVNSRHEPSRRDTETVHVGVWVRPCAYAGMKGPGRAVTGEPHPWEPPGPSLAGPVAVSRPLSAEGFRCPGPSGQGLLLRASWAHPPAPQTHTFPRLGVTWLGAGALWASVVEALRERVA